MLFLHGTDLLARSALLLPAELFAAHQNALTARVHEYKSFADLLHWIDVERPSIVFLFSGYLLTTTGLVSTKELEQLLRILNERGCIVVTNDPCWGLLASKVPMTSDLPAHSFLEKARRAWLEWIIPRRLRQSYRILKHLVHCYPTSVGSALSGQGLRTVGYFNTRLLTSFDRADSAATPDGPRSRDRPYWLFILAGLDYSIQVGVHGKREFVDSLVARLRDANVAGRHAVLIAPDECLTAVKQSGESLDCSLIGFCDYGQYVSLLLLAEYAFYWNVGSSSSLYRLANSLPVFFFDRGHVSRWFQSFFERTVEFLYFGHAPMILDHHEPLQVNRLEPLAERYRESAADIVRQLKRLPEPEALLARLTSSEIAGPANS